MSKAAAAYHPGQGVYRSSYKNALRLTTTENNMAYRTADHERWNDLDFVIGIEIKLNNNHPVYDICDEMCGVYPKTFKFVGWHPFCRCIAVPKLADEDEFIARQQALIDGEDVPQGGYAGEVTEMPQCFTNWVQHNANRIETAKSQPYFIQDNRAAVKAALGGASAAAPATIATATPAKRTIEQAAAERHAKRTPERIEEIQKAWRQRLIRNISNESLSLDSYDDVYSKHIKAMGEARLSGDGDSFKSHYDNARRMLSDLRNKFVGTAIPYTPHKAMQKTYKTLDEVRVSLVTIGSEKKWFPTRRMSNLENTCSGANGSSNRHTGTVKLTPERAKLVSSAMGKIGTGKSWTLTKGEADAMATLWHEMTHQMHIGTESAGGSFSKSRSYMELANEFVSRRTLPDFYKSMGCKVTPYPRFIEKRDSTGYDDMVCAFQYVVNTAKLDITSVVSSIRKGLINSPYDKQKTVLVDGLIAGGMKGRRGDISKLVEMCESEQPFSSILDFIKKNGLMKTS